MHCITYNKYSRTVFHLSALDFCPPERHHSWMLLSMFLHRMPVPDYSEWLCPDPRTQGIRWWMFWFPPSGQRRSSHVTPRPSERRGAKTGRNRSAKILHRKTLVTFNLSKNSKKEEVYRTWMHFDIHILTPSDDLQYKER